MDRYEATRGARLLGTVVIVAIVAAGCGHGDQGGDRAARSSATTAGGAPASNAAGKTTGTTKPRTSGTTRPAGTARGNRTGTSISLPASTTPTVPDPLAKPIADAYAAAFRETCRRIWVRAGKDGRLWDADDPDSGVAYVIGDCLGTFNAGFAFASSTVDEGRQSGHDDAVSAAEDMTIGNRFRTSTGAVFSI